jgi:DNA-directed RNA polymerase subunit RPC12/RpoP
MACKWCELYELGGGCWRELFLDDTTRCYFCGQRGMVKPPFDYHRVWYGGFSSALPNCHVFQLSEPIRCPHCQMENEYIYIECQNMEVPCEQLQPEYSV